MNFKYSHCKIIDPQSEYYGQVFEVDTTYNKLEQVFLIDKQNTAGTYDFSQIQFCVTKDNEPVKIGDEYLCLQDKYLGCEIYDFVEIDGNTRVLYHDTIDFKKDAMVSINFVSHEEHTPLHPTNKVKITAEEEKVEVTQRFRNGELVEMKANGVVIYEK